MQKQIDEIRRSRIYWQCRRGMLELDCLLQDYFHTHAEKLTEAEWQAFENLLECRDDQLFDYFFGQLKPTERRLAHVIESIRASAMDRA